MTTGRFLWVGSLALGCAMAGLTAFSAPGGGQAARQDAAAFFETRVRPVLFENCFACHSGRKQMGGLRLDSREAMRKGGENGPALAQGAPDQSPLIQVIRYDGKVKMPPTGKLKPEEIAVAAIAEAQRTTTQRVIGL